MASKVYIVVWERGYEDHKIRKAFLSEEAADAYALLEDQKIRNPSHISGRHHIEEVELVE